jgi:hypothetical protein
MMMIRVVYYYILQEEESSLPGITSCENRVTFTVPAFITIRLPPSMNVTSRVSRRDAPFFMGRTVW